MSATKCDFSAKKRSAKRAKTFVEHSHCLTASLWWQCLLQKVAFSHKILPLDWLDVEQTLVHWYWKLFAIEIPLRATQNRWMLKWRLRFILTLFSVSITGHSWFYFLRFQVWFCHFPRWSDIKRPNWEGTKSRGLWREFTELTNSCCCCCCCCCCSERKKTTNKWQIPAALGGGGGGSLSNFVWTPRQTLDNKTRNSYPQIS